MIVIVDYGMGNLGSIANMLKKIGTESLITADPAKIESAQKLILPGVGAFDSGMANLAHRNLIAVLNQKVLQNKTPVLGVCLGMQLLTKASQEGSLPGLGWIDASTVKFDLPAGSSLKVPHMGWNTVKVFRSHPLFERLEQEARFYHVHSYHVVCSTKEALAMTEYGYDFVSAVACENVFGVQFHPEKSHRFGMQLLKNFVELG